MRITRSPPTASDLGATTGVRVNRAPGAVAVVGVVGPAGPGRAGDPVRGERGVGDVVVVVGGAVPKQGSPAVLLCLGHFVEHLVGELVRGVGPEWVGVDRGLGEWIRAEGGAGGSGVGEREGVCGEAEEEEEEEDEGSHWWEERERGLMEVKSEEEDEVVAVVRDGPQRLTHCCSSHAHHCIVSFAQLILTKAPFVGYSGSTSFTGSKCSTRVRVPSCTCAMDEPILQLLVEKGRRKGESVECKPGAALRLGRVVRGNTFALRDPGVSQKHLSFEFLRETSRWVVTDLDTSNGTVLNGSQIAPSVPVPLSDGDAIKIGETTYISVKIAGGRPRAAAEDEAAVGRRGRGRVRAPPLPPARSEAEMPLDSVVEEVSEALVANGEGKGRGRGRPRRAAAASAGVSIKDENVDAVSVEESVPEVKGRTRGRRPATRGSSIRVSKEAEEEERRVSATVPDLDDQEAEEKQRVRTRSPNTRATSARVSTEVEEKETESSVRPPNLEVAEACEDGNLLIESNDDSEAQDDGEREGEAKSLDEGGDNMDNMTLGEWFDRMEKFLPQVINDISEEIISMLKERAQRFDMFMATNANAG